MFKSQLLFISLFISLFGALSCQTSSEKKPTQNNLSIKKPMETPVNKSEEEWKKTLTPEQFHILREKGTERPGTGEYNHHNEAGTYACAGCGTDLFTSDQKFDSHCGWPSFDNNIAGGDRVKQIRDFSHGMIRTEIVCATCGGHLGHIFDDGPTATGQRYCVNSLSLTFKPSKK